MRALKDALSKAEKFWCSYLAGSTKESLAYPDAQVDDSTMNDFVCVSAAVHDTALRMETAALILSNVKSNLKGVGTLCEDISSIMTNEFVVHAPEGYKGTDINVRELWTSIVGVDFDPISILENMLSRYVNMAKI